MSHLSHLGHPDRDWPEDFPHENGNYLRECLQCDLSFIGHKRRYVCRSCERANEEAWAKMTPQEQEARIQANLLAVKEAFDRS